MKRPFAAATLAFSALTQAQAWPTKPVKIIVPYPPGGSVDVVTRKMAAKLQEQTGQTFFVENKAGATGTIGLSAVVTVLYEGLPVAVVFGRMVSGMTVFSFLAIPFFIFAGELMLYGGIAHRIVALAKNLVGHVRGGLGMANVFAALRAGVTYVETSFGGLGGCPFTRVAAGNVATEDVVFMLNGLGIDTGIDLDRLVDAGQFISEHLGRKPNSRVATAVLNTRAG